MVREFDGRPIALAHRPDEADRLLRRLMGRSPHFVCTIAHTATAEIEGISAAGATPELRRLTAAADVEALMLGRPVCIQGVPSNPLGAPGPVILTLAGLGLAGGERTVVDAGSRVQPAIDCIRLAEGGGQSVITGTAVSNAEELFARGYALGLDLATRADYLMLGESVPGGTTTALAVLVGLGYDAWGRVSSSMPAADNDLKNRVARRGLLAAGLVPRRGGMSPFAVARGVGDPMQPVVAGILLGASQRVAVVLAGGTQMVAVYALARALGRATGLPLGAAGVAIATTRWVLEDPRTDVRGLLRHVGAPPVVCTAVRLDRSRHAGLRRYEEFMVKEGVGAGGALVAAALRSRLAVGELEAAIDRAHDDLLSA